MRKTGKQVLRSRIMSICAVPVSQPGASPVVKVAAATPPTVSPAEFYQESAKVWRQAYPRWKIDLLRLIVTLRELLRHRTGTASLQRALTEVHRRGDAQAYMQDWGQVPGSASTHVQ